MQFNKPLKYKDLCVELGEKPKIYVGALVNIDNDMKLRERK